MKVKEENEKADLKLNTQNTKIMASGPISSWQIDGGYSGNSDRLYFLGSKITADDDCSHEIKKCLLLRRKVMTNLDSILKSRDIQQLGLPLLGSKGTELQKVTLICFGTSSAKSFSFIHTLSHYSNPQFIELCTQLQEVTELEAGRVWILVSETPLLMVTITRAEP